MERPLWLLKCLLWIALYASTFAPSKVQLPFCASTVSPGGQPLSGVRGRRTQAAPLSQLYSSWLEQVPSPKLQSSQPEEALALDTYTKHLIIGHLESKAPLSINTWKGHRIFTKRIKCRKFWPGNNHRDLSQNSISIWGNRDGNPGMMMQRNKTLAKHSVGCLGMKHFHPLGTEFCNSWSIVNVGKAPDTQYLCA